LKQVIMIMKAIKMNMGNTVMMPLKLNMKNMVMILMKKNIKQKIMISIKDMDMMNMKRKNLPTLQKLLRSLRIQEMM